MSGSPGRATTCYMTQRGVAYQLWAAVEDERLNRGWPKTRMAEHIGLPRNTINRLEDSSEPPQPRTVHKIADALGIDRVEAERKAGLRPGPRKDSDISARDAVRRDPVYTDAQRKTMLDLMDLFEQANSQAPGDEKGRRVG